jgi:hypothetical protein
MYKANIIADSIHAGRRLVTMEVTLPRCVLAEINTHRSHSRNSASSRAIPAERIISAIMSDPFIPEWTAANKGMVAAGPLPAMNVPAADAAWLRSRDTAVECARALTDLGVAKQDANRLLEPFMYTTIVATAIDRAWDWFFGLRDDGAADPKIAKAARLMHEVYDASTPEELSEGEWHLPYISEKDRRAVDDVYGQRFEINISSLHRLPFNVSWQQAVLASMSAARCARISYLRQHEDRSIVDEVARACDLVRSKHWSPTEHQALVKPGHAQGGSLGNGQPFAQFRHLIGDGY